MYRFAVSKKDKRASKARVDKRTSSKSAEDIAVSKSVPDGIDEFVRIRFDPSLV